MQQNDYDYDSDNENYYEEIDENLLEELEENRKFNVLYNFKNFIQKESQFIAIKNISSFDILEIINSYKKINNYFIEPYLIVFFDDLYIQLNGIKGHKDQYGYLCEEIFKKIYV
jgi:hypothetical protein